MASSSPSRGSLLQQAQPCAQYCLGYWGCVGRMGYEGSSGKPSHWGFCRWCAVNLVTAVQAHTATAVAAAATAVRTTPHVWRTGTGNTSVPTYSLPVCPWCWRSLLCITVGGKAKFMDESIIKMFRSVLQYSQGGICM